MNNPCASAFSCPSLTKDQNPAQDQNNPGCRHSGFCIPSPGPSAQKASPERLPLHLRTRLPGDVRSSIHQHCWVSYTPGQPLNLTLSHQITTGIQKNNPCCTFWWECSHLICIRAQCFFYKAVTACDASITYTASGNMDKAESLPKIKTCQSRSKYEALFKLRWRAIHRHRHLLTLCFYP